MLRVTSMIGCALVLVIALPGVAQETPTPTAVPTATPTPTPVPTATPTPGTPSVTAPESVLVGVDVVVSGTAPDGPACVCVVPAGVFPLGVPYDGATLQCTEITVADGVFSAVTVLQNAPAGSYDVLLLGGSCAGSPPLIAGQYVDERVGLVVRQAPAIPAAGAAGWAVILLLVMGAGLLILRRL